MAVMEAGIQADFPGDDPFVPGLFDVVLGLCAAGTQAISAVSGEEIVEPGAMPRIHASTAAFDGITAGFGTTVSHERLIEGNARSSIPMAGSVRRRDGDARAMLQRHHPFAPPLGEYHHFGKPAAGADEMVEAVSFRTPYFVDPDDTVCQKGGARGNHFRLVEPHRRIFEPDEYAIKSIDNMKDNMNNLVPRWEPHA